VRRLTTVVVVLSLGCGWGVVSHAEADDAAIALARESEAYCASTAREKPTVQIIVDKVEQAVALLEKEGAAAFPKFQGKGSEFIFNGTYIWVHSADGRMLMHPIKADLVGGNVFRIKDVHGKPFFREMNEKVEKEGCGWVEYRWPKPGEKRIAVKASYVHGAIMDGKKVVVGCGVYDLTQKDAEAASRAGAGK
jgi:cytochrome c